MEIKIDGQLSSILAAKRFDALPPGSSCVCCGADLAGKPGWVVETKGPSVTAFGTVCPSDFAAIKASETKAVESEPEPEPELEPEPVKVEAPSPVSASTMPDVAAALKTLSDALVAPKVAPVDEAKIVAKAVEAAHQEALTIAQKTTEDCMRMSIADFMRSGASCVAAEADVAEAPTPSCATGDGVKASASASSWKAKATAESKAAVEKLSNFLSEFSYFHAGPSMRLINTFAIARDKKDALKAYCEVSQMEDLPELIEKMKSPEFQAVCDAFAPFKPEPLNRRFAVFYGAPGGGKTYAAIKAGERINGGACDVVPCSPSMDAADMLYAYRLDYKTGRRGYVPTALLTAMVAGRAVVLDEVNLLPMEARMFLQNILDNKSKVHIMGAELPIRDGFFVLGTMNLETGLGASSLPLPLVDRASVVREFKTTAAQAAVGAGLC